MIQRHRRRGVGPWRPGCEGLESRALLSLEFVPLPPGFGSFAIEPPTPPLAPKDAGLEDDSPAFEPFRMFLGFPPPTGFPMDSPFDPGLDEGREQQSPTLQVIGVEPSDGAALDRSPEALAVRFDLPLDPLSVSSDLLVLRADPAGGWRSVFDEALLPFSRVDVNDPTRLVLEFGEPLGPGEYRLVLSGFSNLTDLTGQHALPDRGTDILLAEFSIEVPGATFGDAVPLGIIGPRVRMVEGSLDFAANPLEVAIYRITLPGSHRQWRLGVEVVASGIGSPLDAALSLFDADGRVLAVAEDGGFVGLPDPHLFTGLAPGTYYIGVSGLGNLAGLPGGYDLATGNPGTVTQVQSGGVFQLNLVADPVGASVTRAGFRLTHADPAHPVPTGFDIQFTGLVRGANIGPGQAASLSTALDVVDQDGRVWPIEATAYNGENARLSFVFLSRLPEGRYTVQLASSGGLVDLSNRAPRTPGLPAGTLAVFSVGPTQPLVDPHDLGPVFEADLGDGLSATLDLKPGESRDLRFVLLRSTDLRLTVLREGGPVELELVDVAGGERRVIDLGAPGDTRNAFELLKAGEYVLRARAAGSEPVRLDLRLRFSGTLPESLSPRGVGQVPALSMRLVAPGIGLANEVLPDVSTSTGFSGVGAPYPSPPEPVVPTPGPGVAPAPGPPSTRPENMVVGLGAVESRSLLAVATGPVGMPSDESGFAAPLSENAVAAVVAAETGVVSSAFGDPSNPLAASGLPLAVVGSWGTPSTNGAIPQGENQEAGDPENVETPAPLVVAGLENLAGLFQRLIAQVPRFGGGADARIQTTSVTGPGDPTLEAALTVTTSEIEPSEDPASPEGHRVKAVLQVTVGLGVLAATVLQVRDYVARRARRILAQRRRGQAASKRHAPACHLRMSRSPRERV